MMSLSLWYTLFESEIGGADAAVLANAEAEQAAQTADADIAKESDASGATGEAESFGNAGEVANAPNA